MVERFCDSCWGKREERERDAEQAKKFIETDVEKINQALMKERFRGLLSS